MTPKAFRHSSCTDWPAAPDREGEAQNREGEAPAEPRFSRPRSARTEPRPAFRRGTAEIELLFGVMVLIVILLLVRGGYQLAISRIGTGEQAEMQAFNDATAASPPMYADGIDVAPVVGYSDIRPGLPNRVHVPHLSQNLTIGTGDPQRPVDVTISSSAAVAGPPWTFSGYPAGSSDQALHAEWFLQYVDESHVERIDPLALAPPWAP
mgnify:CR=1 FL=1